MYRTLLADDDFLVRSYLKTLNAWNKAGYEIIKDVQDGEEAEAFMESEQVDVLITDISMPVMDGIELIRKIREKNSGIYIIVLSCHDDFEYVKEAMKLGADEYILKNTLDEDNLYETLENSARLIDKRKQQFHRQEQNRKLIKMGSHAMKYHFFNGLISGTLKGNLREEKRAEAGITGKFVNSAVICMFVKKWPLIEKQWSPLEIEQYSHNFRHRLIEKLEEHLGAENESGEVICLGTGIYCYFLDLSGICKSSAMRQRLTEAAAVCYRFCCEDFCDMGIGVSGICMGEDGIRRAYQQAREMMKLYFYEKKDVLYYEDDERVSTQLPKACGILLGELPELKNKKDSDRIQKLWTEVTEEAWKLHTEGRLLIQWLKKLDHVAELEREPDFYDRLDGFDGLKKTGEAYSEELLKKEKEELPEGISPAVRCAVQFVRDNYQKPISLQDAAGAADVNPAYLSYLFKQEMEIGFSNYLQDCRIGCARELLVNTNYKVREIAIMAGFSDYHYFSRTFKKVTGLSPAEFRKNGCLS